MSLGVIRHCDCDCTEPPPPTPDDDIDYLCWHPFSGVTGWDTATRTQLLCCSEVYGDSQLNNHYLTRTTRRTMTLVIPDLAIDMEGWTQTVSTWNRYTGEQAADVVTAGGDAIDDIILAIAENPRFGLPTYTVNSNTVDHQSDTEIHSDGVDSSWTDTFDIQLSSIYTVASFRADCAALYANHTLINLLTSWDGTTHGYIATYNSDGSIGEISYTTLATSVNLGFRNWTKAWGYDPITRQPGAYYELEFPAWEGEPSTCAFWGRKIQYKIKAGNQIEPSTAYAHHINNQLFCHDSVDSTSCSDVTTPASGFAGLECSTEGNEQLVAGTC